MSEGRYNISKRYKVDKGMPIEALSQRIDNEKCRAIFETEIASITWCYQIIDDDDSVIGPAMLIRQPGISVFEVKLNQKESPELMTEMLTSLIPKRSIITYICDGEMATAAFVPAQNGYGSKMCVTDFYPYDFTQLIELMNYELDTGKDIEQIHRRMLSMVRQQKRIIMVEKAFANLERINQPELENEMDLLFAEENLNQIREDADFVQEQLHVMVS